MKTQLVAAALATVACSSTLSAQKAGCSYQPGDSVFLAGGIAYRECAVDKKAKLVSAGNPSYSGPTGYVSSASLPQCQTAAFEFVVDTLGRPEANVVNTVRSTDPEWTSAMRMNIYTMKFKPAEKNGAKVRQIYTFKTTMALVVGSRYGTMPRPPC